MAKRSRRYSNWVKQQVKLRYPLCRTTQDRLQLAAELDIRDENGEPSVSKLYNLASRLGATGRDGASRAAVMHADSEHAGRRREDPDTTTFTEQADRYLRDEFGRRTVEEIAVYLRHTPTAVLYRARKLGLRKPVKYWPARKVAAWLSISMDQLRELTDEGIDIIPQADRDGRLTLEVVSTTSLGRWLRNEKNLAKVREAGADEFFIREILETLEEIASGKSEWERCKFLSYGHVCQNTYAKLTSYGLFCTNTDRQGAGQDPNCRYRTLTIDDLRPPHRG